MIPEAAVAMLACARIGAVHSVVFGGFSPDSLANRILDSDCSLVITADQGRRGDRFVPLKENTDTALKRCPNVRHVIVVRHTSSPIPFHAGRDVWYHEIVESASSDFLPQEVRAEHPFLSCIRLDPLENRKASYIPLGIPRIRLPHASIRI